ncbi:hypothetical protein TNCV_3907501 [Trichonephila clavipes]|nr:hypothetical protein TNCV_3907501 [Trichonephila clavipes]
MRLELTQVNNHACEAGTTISTILPARGDISESVFSSLDTSCEHKGARKKRVQTPSEEIITLSSCFGEQRVVEVKPINLSLNQHFPSLSVRTAISPTLTEEFIIHPSVYSEIEKLGHAKSDVLLNESESSLGAHAYALLKILLWSPWKYRCGRRNAVKNGRCGMQPNQNTVFARRRIKVSKETETVGNSRKK